MKYTFKPLNNMHLYFMLIFYIFPVSFFDIACIIVSLEKFDIQFFIICVIITALPFLVYVIVRILYPYKYVINDEYLVKYKKNKILFKIKIKDIKYIAIKKVNILDYFKFIISLISYYNLSTANLTTMSLIFEKCEILDDFNSKEFKRDDVVKNKETNEKEFVEILSYRKIKKICKIVNIEYKIK